MHGGKALAQGFGQLLAIGGQADPAPLTLHKRTTKLVFQRTDLLGYGSMGHIQGPRRLRKASHLCRRRKRPQCR